MPLCVSCDLGRGWLGVPDVSSVAVDRERVPVPKLKKQRGQWSNGTAPGEYGGPPLSLEPLRMWGKPRLHPLETKDEFIWNIEWRPFFDREQAAEEIVAEEAESSSGFISFNRVAEINRVDVDLTKELVHTTPTPPPSPAAAGAAATANGHRWRFAPTRNERRQWDRARKASETLRSERDSVATATASSRQREKERYKRLKSGLQVLTVGIGGAGTVCAYVAYSPTVALSYGIGLAGSLAYVRMLGNSVDAFGSQDVKGAARAAVGQPRLLVPVILTMIFNRWNELLAPELGVAELQLIPMLVGFFTYKIATMAQVVQDALPQESRDKLE
ncbi:uncharacterized protein LOC9649226 [Selaginella moellendorffii]|uniref:uncharacterized protein LOC9649226 n=1 Tax=Selaginella moellendorffii TaxID=88036 RepID=UPI000D1CF688|nr:uncharacterized protein LOC9649226 [Selaginella moellendorffii]|eukprot:XP_024515981.1 uncharacterized protein LOC9649226 [Selaginella moellendorffii]